MTRPERSLQATGPNEPIAAPINAEDAETAAERRQRLARECEFHAGRLAELAKLDPHDFTGLKRVYDEHLRRAQAAFYADV